MVNYHEWHTIVTYLQYDTGISLISYESFYFLQFIAEVHEELFQSKMSQIDKVIYFPLLI